MGPFQEQGRHWGLIKINFRSYMKVGLFVEVLPNFNHKWRLNEKKFRKFEKTSKICNLAQLDPRTQKKTVIFDVIEHTKAAFIKKDLKGNSNKQFFSAKSFHRNNVMFLCFLVSPASQDLFSIFFCCYLVPRVLL